MEPLGILSLDRKKYTQAMAENLPALRLYESYGFALTGAEDEDGEIEMALRV